MKEGDEAFRCWCVYCVCVGRLWKPTWETKVKQTKKTKRLS